MPETLLLIGKEQQARKEELARYNKALTFEASWIKLALNELIKLVSYSEFSEHKAKTIHLVNLMEVVSSNLLSRDQNYETEIEEFKNKNLLNNKTEYSEYMVALFKAKKIIERVNAWEVEQNG